MENNNPYAPPIANVTNLTESAQDELAGRGHRLAAALIDGLLMMVIVVPLQFLTGAFGRSARAAQEVESFLGRMTANLGEGLAWGAFAMVLWVALNFAFLAKGQTIGKRILDIRVVRKNGDALERKRYVLLRYFPVTLISLVPLVGWIFSWVDCLLIFRADKNTLHDDIADTKVVKVAT